MQEVSIGAISATGIVGTLVILGAALKFTGIMEEIGTFAITAGIVIAVVLGILGIIGVASRYM